MWRSLGIPLCQVLIGLTSSMASMAWGQDPSGPVPGFCQVREVATGNEDGATLYGEPDAEYDDLGLQISREMRLTVGGGLGLQSYTVRLSSTDRAINGGAFVFWPTKGSHRVLGGHPKCQEHFDAQDVWLAGLAAKGAREELGCGDVHSVEVFEVCVVRFSAEPRWAELLAQVDSLGLWSLPDPVTLPPPKYVSLDAPGLTVALRDKTTFRQFRYWSAPDGSNPEADRAAQIKRLVLQVFEQAADSHR